MSRNTGTQLTVLVGGRHRLEALHDRVMKLLDTHEKSGIRNLLQKNSESCKKLLFPLIVKEENQAAVMTALVGILEAHARECYTIGYIDCATNRNVHNDNEIYDNDF